MYYGNIKKYDIADGEGVRVTLFVSGCTNHCLNCFQPETWDFNYGKPYTKETEDDNFSKGEMREKIRHERRIEFAGEGLYYNDIRRWRTAEDVMNTPIEDYAGNALAVRYFDPDKDYWWPVPESQILLNDALEQNPNY